jgi:uncharacterized protein (DUF169 family)
MTTDWAELAHDLTGLLHLAEPPIGIAWRDSVPVDIAPFDEPMPDPAADGRTGRVAAPCVFWMRAAHGTFSTVAADHGNCSVGLMTHGWKTLDEVAGNSDVAALLDSGWVTMDVVPQIPVVTHRPTAMVYGPLVDATGDPDVVLIRVNAKQLMVLADAYPGLRVEGKPQCHILAIAKEEGEPAASVGCTLSRVRTGMRADEMTVAIPGGRVREFVGRLQDTHSADSAVAQYAAQDAARFG